MNYYEHHIGDYAAATAHLSLVEDAVYSRMLRRYYLTESALPAEKGNVARLVGARSPEEVAAVEAVLAEFFRLSDDGWHQKRCDEDIHRFREKQGKARASAQARWDVKPQCERNANASKTHSERNAHQTPDTNLHTPEKKQKQKQAGKPAVVLPEWLPADVWADWADNRKAAGKALTLRAAELSIRSLAALRDEGYDPRTVIENAIEKGWTGLYAPKGRGPPQAKPSAAANFRGTDYGTTDIDSLPADMRDAVRRELGNG